MTKTLPSGSDIRFDCHLWLLRREDDLRLGFTDHDLDLQVEGQVFRANSGFSAAALQRSTGLSVDNSAALGALSDQGLQSEDLLAGRFDRAEIWIWRCDWREPSARQLLFRGFLGEVLLQGASFQVETRGLSEALSQDQGRVYTRQCGAVLGDQHCGFDLNQPGYAWPHVIEDMAGDGRVFWFKALGDPAPHWFEGGRMDLRSGKGKGLWRMIKSDRFEADRRRVELWQSFRSALAPGDQLTLRAGCDKSAATCRLKFGNLLNFRGFPHLPGEDWITAYPRDGVIADGGSLFKPVQNAR